MAITDDGSFGKFLPSVPISELTASCLVGHSHDTRKDTRSVAAQDGHHVDPALNARWYAFGALLRTLDETLLHCT